MKLDKKKFLESLKMTLRNLGNATGKVLEGLEKQNKAINEKISRATGGFE